MTEHKLNTSAGGRGYIADYFKTQLKRHDFTTYINERLAADFACVLAQHLEAEAAARRESFAALERENEELKTQLRLAAGDADEKDRLIEQLKYPQMCLEARKADAAEAVKLQRLLMADYRACRPMGEGLMGWAAAALQEPASYDFSAAANEIADQFKPGFFNDDMVRDVAAIIARHSVRAAAVPPAPVEIEYPTYHAQGMGCGLEDRGITDRYEAMAYGFQEGLDQMAAIIDGLGPLYASPLSAKPAIRIELVSPSPGSGLHIRVWNDLAGLEPGTYELYLPVQP